MPGRSPYAGSSDLVALGRALRTLRERRGLAQTAVCFDARVGRGYLGMVEAGNFNPSFMTLLWVVRTLGCPLAEAVAEYNCVLSEIDPQAGVEVPACPTPEALAHLRRVSERNLADYYTRKARRARSRMR